MKVFLKKLSYFLIIAFTIITTSFTFNAYADTDYSKYDPSYMAPPILEFQSHVSNIGWMDWKLNGEVTGTVGQGLPMEAIRIKTTSRCYDSLHIQYSVYVANQGWTNWVQDGEVAGTTGKNLPILGIRIKAVDSNYNLSKNYSITYCTHSSNIGWSEIICKDGITSGEVWGNNPVEAIGICLVKNQPEDFVVQSYNSVEGWSIPTPSEWVGSTGRNLPLKGVRFTLPTVIADGNTHIKYRVFVENLGWLDWVQDGETAGVPEKNLNIKAIEMKIVDNNGNLSTRYEVHYNSHLSNVGWEDSHFKDGVTSGNTQSPNAIEAIFAKILDK